VPPIESIRTMVGKDHLWPIDNVWDYHAGGGAFKDLHVFTDALNARFGPASSAEDYALKSQMQTYEGVRAMYEAYSRNKYTSTGVIQWMLNNAWPSMIWHLYDFYLRPGGGYFGAKRAMQSRIPCVATTTIRSLVSSQYMDAQGLKRTAKFLNLDMSEKFSKELSLDAVADSTSKVLTLPDIDGLSPTYFLVLRLQDASGKLAGSNFYWLSTKPETLDWEKSNWYTTPTSSYADYTALSQLPKVKLKVADHTERKGEEAVTHVALENPSKSLAFFVRLKVNKGKGGDEILGDLADNYISCCPAARDRGQLSSPELGGQRRKLSSWNVGSQPIPRRGGRLVRQPTKTRQAFVRTQWQRWVKRLPSCAHWTAGQRPTQVEDQGLARQTFASSARLLGHRSAGRPLNRVSYLRAGRPPRVPIRAGWAENISTPSCWRERSRTPR
jgi:exo-1,4-beta-D-glucosaminidase